MALEKGVRVGGWGVQIEGLAGTVETKRRDLERRQSLAKTAYCKGVKIWARDYRNEMCNAQNQKK